MNAKHKIKLPECSYVLICNIGFLTSSDIFGIEQTFLKSGCCSQLFVWKSSLFAVILRLLLYIYIYI